MARVEVYTIQGCAYCGFAKQLLHRRGIAFREHDLTELPDEELREKMIALSGRRTVPQVVIDGRPIGGYEDLRRLDESGELSRLLGP